MRTKLCFTWLSLNVALKVHRYFCLLIFFILHWQTESCTFTSSMDEMSDTDAAAKSAISKQTDGKVCHHNAGLLGYKTSQWMHLPTGRRRSSRTRIKMLTIPGRGHSECSIISWWSQVPEPVSSGTLYRETVTLNHTDHRAVPVHTPWLLFNLNCRTAV